MRHFFSSSSLFFVLLNLNSFCSEISKAKVIDMTGREQRVLQGYSALRSKRTEEPSDSEPTPAGLKVDKFQLEKLCYNLDTLVDHCEHVRFHCHCKFV